MKGFKSLSYIIDKYIISNINLSNININRKKTEENKKSKKLDSIIKNNNNNPTKKKLYKNRKLKKNAKSFNINILKSNDENFNNKSTTRTMNNNLKNNKNQRIEDIYNDYEINSLIYKEALKLDRRTYIKYYFSLLKRKQILIFTFYISNDYNSKSIKICLLLFSFALYYTVNALFFNDSTMHKIYIDKDKYDFIYQISNILYSTLISSIINIIIKYLSLTEMNIIEMKNNNNEKEKNIKIKKCIIIKLILFFILNFFFLYILFLCYL